MEGRIVLSAVDGLEGRIVAAATTHHVAKVHHAKAHHAKPHNTKAHNAKAHNTATTPQAPTVAPQPEPTVQTGTAIQAAPTPLTSTPSAPAPPAPTSPAAPFPVPTTPTTSVNQQVVAFLNQKLGQRIGSGECTDLAVEALRSAGARFAGFPDNPTPGDYVWGTPLKTMSAQGGQAVDSAPGVAIQPGDVLQFSGATFANGASASHHTAVVAAVDAAGRVTQVFEQNIRSGGGPANRTDTLSTLDLTGLTGGTVAVYHPMTRAISANTAMFTVVNNAATPETIALFGNVVTLTAAGTLGSMMTFAASGTPQLALNGLSYLVSDGVGYQIVGTGATAVLQGVA